MALGFVDKDHRLCLCIGHERRSRVQGDLVPRAPASEMGDGVSDYSLCRVGAEVDKIEKFASYKSRVTLHGLDALALIKKLGDSTPANTLFYLDPPYYRKAEKLYDNHYKPADHAELAEAVAQLDRPWVVSYDNQPEIRTLYSAFRQEVFGINYSAGPVAKGSEVMIYGPRINASANAVSTWRGIAA